MTTYPKNEDFFTHLYRNLYDFDPSDTKSLEDQIEQLEAAGIKTTSFFKKVENLVKRQRMEIAVEEKLKAFVQRIPKLEDLKVNLAMDSTALTRKLQEIFGSGQAKMALRNYGVTNESDLKSLLEDYEFLEELNKP